MKKAVILLFLAVTMVGLTATQAPTFASDKVVPVEDAAVDTMEMDSDMVYNPVDYIKSLKGITEKERNILLDTENSLKGTRDQIDKIESEISDISDKIFGNFYDRYDEIASQNTDLWEKLYMDQPYFEYDANPVDQINKSKNLTSKEKKILLAHQKKLDALNKECDALLAKADNATVKQNAKLDELYAVIDAADEKNMAIWDKVAGTPILEKAPINWDSDECRKVEY